jgi:hypothetical protein
MPFSRLLLGERQIEELAASGTRSIFEEKTMDETKTNGAAGRTETRQQPERGRGRRRWEMSSADVRFFLPKAGSSPEKPELGREVTNEGEALVESFKANQPFYTLVLWKATHEFDGEDTKIVKQVVARGTAPRT